VKTTYKHARTPAAIFFSQAQALVDRSPKLTKREISREARRLVQELRLEATQAEFLLVRYAIKELEFQLTRALAEIRGRRVTEKCAET
jgi:hypothetical protein